MRFHHYTMLALIDVRARREDDVPARVNAFPAFVKRVHFSFAMPLIAKVKRGVSNNFRFHISNKKKPRNFFNGAKLLYAEGIG